MTLRAIGWWLDDKSAQWLWFSWIVHGIMALPLVAVAAWQPWTTPGLVFLYREGEQVWFRYMTESSFDWLDHVMDVLTPGLVGWFLLR